MEEKFDKYKKAVSHLKSSDKILSDVIDNIGECKINYNGREAFDTLASSIISQQLSAKAAHAIKCRLLNNLRVKRPLRPKHIDISSHSNIRKAGLSDAKAKYLKNLAKVFISREISIRNLKEMEDEEVVMSLTAYPGIGRWTAEMFLIFALGREDIFSISDAGLRRAVRIIYGLKAKPLDEEFYEITNIWRPYRSIGSWYLWRYLDER